MKNTISERLMNNPVYVILINITIFVFLYLAIVSIFWLSILIISIIVALLIYLDQTGLIDIIFKIYSENRITAFLSLIVFIIIFPFIISENPYLVHITIMAFIYSIIALGLNFQMGSTGMVNFAPAVFFGTGAYTTSLLAVKFGISPWLGSISGIILSVIVGYIIGLPTLKTKGYYLSLITIALQMIFNLWIINTSWMGGPDGISGIPSYTLGAYSFRNSLIIFGMKLPYGVHYYFIAAVVLIIAAIISSRLHNSRVGLSWNAIAGDEIAAICHGINIPKSKLFAFCVGASFAGAAGAIYAHYMSFVGPQDFDFSKSLIIICMVILGGMDNVLGVICGAVLLTLLDEKLRDFSDFRMLLYVAVLIVILVIRPEGLIPKRIRKYVNYFRKATFCK